MNTLNQTKTYVASKKPVIDINKISYEGQNPLMKMYRSGYEDYMNNLPKTIDGVLDGLALSQTAFVMNELSQKIIEDNWITKMSVPTLEFQRTIIGLESPIENEDGSFKEGAELVVAHWGNRFKSPVHGHSPGYLHEEVLFGKIKVFTYRIIDKVKKIVRPRSLEIKEKGVFVSKYNTNEDGSRDVLVHNFESIGESATLHFLPEHTRDGRDNQFYVEHWSSVFPLLPKHVERITSKDGMYQDIGTVILVRSENVPEYGDHFIVVVGRPVTKEHGIRPEDVSIMASPIETVLLEEYPMKMGLTLLKLNEEARQSFFEFHGITMENGKVIFSD